MKSYTDLEQSKKLAEFLSIKSADMYYHNRVDIPDNYPLLIEWKHNNPLLSQEIPCWSLAALLDVLRYPELTQNVENKWFISDWTGAYPKSEYDFDSPVDACYRMIVKLHELNLL